MSLCPQNSVSADEMLQDARTAASTGRAAESRAWVERQLWAVSNIQQRGRFADIRRECEPEHFLIKKADLQLAPLSYDPVLQRVGPVRPIANCRSRWSISALFFSGKWHIVLLNAQETAGIVLGLSALE
jgi:hypothetical protein